MCDFKDWALKRFKKIDNISIHACGDLKMRTIVYLKDGRKGVAVCDDYDYDEMSGVLMAYIKATEKSMSRETFIMGGCQAGRSITGTTGLTGFGDSSGLWYSPTQM